MKRLSSARGVAGTGGCVLASLALLLGTVGAAGAVPSAGAPSAEGAAAADAATTDAIAGYVRSHPQEFGGVWRDGADGTLVVSVVPGSEASAADGVRSAAGRAEKALRLRFVTTRYDQADLDRTMSGVPSVQPWASMVQPYLSIWYVDPRRDQVVIGVTQLSATLVDAARKAFGDRVVLVAHARMTEQAARIRLTSPPKVVRLISPAAVTGCGQLTACPPWYGGQRIIYWTSNDVVECTTGFGWVIGSTLSMTTAGHCGPNGRVWYPGYYDEGTNTVYYNDVPVGTAKVRTYGNGATDVELLTNNSGTGYGPYVFTGRYAVHAVNSYHQPVVGHTLCADGSFTGEVCAGTVQSVDACYFVGEGTRGVTTCNLTEVTSQSRLAQPGDSGGPAYEYPPASPGKLDAQGTIVAGNDPGTDLLLANMNGMVQALGGAPITTS